MYRIYSLILFVIALPAMAEANTSSIAAIRLRESELVKVYRSLSSNILSDSHDSLAHLFRKNFGELLQEEISSAYPFDSLRRYVSICKSKDGKLRTFSWDELEGGTWHNMTAYAQYRTASGKLAVKRLDSDMDDETETGAFSDVRIYTIHELAVNGTTTYLLLGSGTHGAGMHHAMARVFQINSELLELQKNTFGKIPELVTEIPRSFPPDMRYDDKTGVLSFNTYSFGDETTGRGRGLKPVEYVLVNGTFVKR